MDYKSRIKIPINIGDNTTQFFTGSKLHIAIGYNCIVIGQRGPYIEFNDNMINQDNINLPQDQEWRLNSTKAYYVEFRTADKSNVKIYYQLKEVNYADYKVGKFYISPFDLYINNCKVIEELK